MTTSLAKGTNELRRICELPTGSALPRAARFLADLVKHRAFLGSQVLPLLEEAEVAKGWYVADRFDAHDGSYSLQVFVWPSGTETMIHDHSSWGAYACAIGTVLEERTIASTTAPDGVRPLKKPGSCGGARRTAPRRAAATVASRVETHATSRPFGASVRATGIRGRRADYDLSRDYVCDRTGG